MGRESGWRRAKEGGVVRGKKSRCCKKEKKIYKRIFKGRDEEGKPRRGSCGRTCLLRQKCDSAPPGLRKT